MFSVYERYRLLCRGPRRCPGPPALANGVGWARPSASLSQNHVDDHALSAPWYVADATVIMVKQELEGRPDGSFIIRNSTSQPGNFVLSYTEGGSVKNAHIEGSLETLAQNPHCPEQPYVRFVLNW